MSHEEARTWRELSLKANDWWELQSSVTGRDPPNALAQADTLIGISIIEIIS